MGAINAEQLGECLGQALITRGTTYPEHQGLGHYLRPLETAYGFTNSAEQLLQCHS